LSLDTFQLLFVIVTAFHPRHHNVSLWETCRYSVTQLRRHSSAAAWRSH